jgi:hypothetical protein
MKFATSILAFALTAQATLVVRDLATVQGVLTDIAKQTDAVDQAVKSFSGDISGLTSAADKLTALLKSGTTTVSGTSPLPLQDAATVSQFVTGLNSSVATLISDLIGKKEAFVAAGKGGTVLKTLQDQQAASKALADALTSKVPEALQSVAKQLSQGIDDSIASGVAAFNGLTDTAGGGGSSSSGAPTTTSSSSSGGDHHASTTSSSSKPTGSAPTSSGAAPSKSSSAPAASSSKPAVSTGGAYTNGFSGALAAVAAILAF